MEWLTWLFTWPAKWTRFQWRLVYWIVHILIVVLIVAILAWINYSTGLERLLRTRTLNLHQVWLPLLFLLGYSLFWLLRWVYSLLGPDGAVGEFDDIESAWAEAKSSLNKGGISLSDAPLYLVLGRSAGTLESVFASMKLLFQVRHAPTSESPLHVYASREAIFVTCEGASLLPLQVARLLTIEAPPPQPTSLLGENLSDLADSAEASLVHGDSPGTEPAGGVATAVLPTSRTVLLLGEQVPPPDAPRKKRRPSLLRDQETVDLQSRRLQHVCRLLVRDRQPYCPVNGVLALIPLAATDTPEDATETAEVLRHDFQVSRSSLQLDSPRFIVLCDAEQLPGFAELAQHFPENTTGPSWVLGQHYPLLPDVPPAQISSVVESGLGWVADTLLPVVVGGLWRREGEPAVTDRVQVVETNMRLYSFLNACRQRLAVLGRLAGRAVTTEDGPPLLGGCYVTGTGADVRDQAFFAGVIQLALEQQNSVRWTPTALEDDTAYSRYAVIGYFLLLIFVAVVVAMLWIWW